MQHEIKSRIGTIYPSKLFCSNRFDSVPFRTVRLYVRNAKKGDDHSASKSVQIQT